VLVRRAGDIQVSATDIVDGLVVDQEGTIRVLDGAVGSENGIVGLDDCSADPGGRVDRELKLAFLRVIGRKALQEKGAKAGTSTTAEGVENEEALQAGTVV